MWKRLLRGAWKLRLIWLLQFQRSSQQRARFIVRSLQLGLPLRSALAQSVWKRPRPAVTLLWPRQAHKHRSSSKLHHSWPHLCYSNGVKLLHALVLNVLWQLRLGARMHRRQSLPKRLRGWRRLRSEARKLLHCVRPRHRVLGQSVLLLQQLVRLSRQV